MAEALCNMFVNSSFGDSVKPRHVLALMIAIALLISATAVSAKTAARCGFSLGAVGGASIPTLPELKDEFPYLYHFEVNAKYYFLQVFSGSLDLGYEFGQGMPKRIFYKGKMTELDGRGSSYWSAMPYWATLRLEPLRRYAFNPYVGAAAGGRFLNLQKKGRSRQIAIADSGKEWLLGWMGLAGMDYRFTDFVFLRLEGRYSSTPGRVEKFFESKDYGAYDVLLGINIYF
jgi:opacity protein-like surface antigen